MVTLDSGRFLHRTGLTVLVALLAVVMLVAGCGDDDGPTGPQAMTFSDTLSTTYPVDYGPVIDVKNFVGNVTVRPSGTGLVEVTTRKWAASEADLDKIVVTVGKIPTGVNIEAKNPTNVQNVQVDFVISAPEISSWNMDVDVGNIDYEGRPKGACGFSTSVGQIKIKLPQNMNAVLNLSTGGGAISLVGFQLDGQASSSSVMGTIGNGTEAEIAASTNVGTISVGP
jgi:hypothetical protein